MLDARRFVRRPGFVVFLFIIAMMWVSSVRAQSTGDDTVGEGRGYFTVGVGMLDVSALNERLTSTGYPTLSERMLAIGGGGHGIRGRWLFGGEGQALAGRTRDAARAGQNFEVTVDAGYGLFDLGYLMVKKDGFHLYPLVGFGAGGANIRISESSSPTFDEVLVNPRRDVSLSTAGLLMQVGLGGDKLFVLKTRDVNARLEERGLVIGVRVGYVFTPLQSDWTRRATRVAGGPDLGITGPYVRIIVGGGARYSAR